MHKELDDLFDQGIDFVATMLVGSNILEAEYGSFEKYDDYMSWLKKIDRYAKENFSNHPATQLLSSSFNRIDFGCPNLLHEHQVVLDLILQLIRYDYRHQ